LAGGRVSPPIKLLSWYKTRSHNTEFFRAVARFFPQLRRICQVRPLSPNLYIYYTVIKEKNQQRNSNRCQQTSFAGVSTYSDWLVTAAALTELAPTNKVVGIH
jgi:hypothetical protein